MIKWLLLGGSLLAGSALVAHAQDRALGLGSQLVAQILQLGTVKPAASDLIQIFQGQNGDPAYSKYTQMFNVPVYTIALLPTCSANVGLLGYVSNGVATPAYRDTVAATGATNQLVWCDGTNWTYR